MNEWNCALPEAAAFAVATADEETPAATVDAAATETTSVDTAVVASSTAVDTAAITSNTVFASTVAVASTAAETLRRLRLLRTS